jgi:outer membrane protein TolC
MGQARAIRAMLLAGALSTCGCVTDGSLDASAGLPPQPDNAVFDLQSNPAPGIPANTPPLPAAPVVQTDERPLPINLPTALQLAHARALDVAVAAQQVQLAAAALEQAQVLWLPSITLGADYYRHDGPIQDVSNAMFNDSHSGAMLGVGSGIGPAAVLVVNDAIFAPLVAKQQIRVRQANLQAAANDTLLAVSDAYFTVQQARGELAGAIDATRRTEELVARTKKLAPAIVPDLELFRAETELARRQETELFARERWKVAGAELLRVLRMDPSAQVEPAEPPQLRVDLIDLKKPVDELIPIGLTYRPELASQQAQVQATLTLIKQERLRPLIPSLLLRGASTNPSGTLGEGVFFPSPAGSKAGMRSDVDVELLWQLNNLGFGNRALVHQRETENRLALVELFRTQDRIAAEVAQSYAQAQLAARRVEVTERGLRSALQSTEKNLAALREAKAVGNQLVTLVRPQEVVAAIQALGQAYIDYYGAVADSNRAQFRLYRAMGQPAQYLAKDPQVPAACPPGPLSSNPP